MYKDYLSEEETGFIDAYEKEKRVQPKRQKKETNLDKRIERAKQYANDETISKSILQNIIESEWGQGQRFDDSVGRIIEWPENFIKSFLISRLKRTGKTKRKL